MASPQRPAGPVGDCVVKNAADYFIIDFMVGGLRYRHIHQGTENFDITISMLITQVVLNFVAYFSDFHYFLNGTTGNRVRHFSNWGNRHHDPILITTVLGYVHTEAARESALSSSARVCE